MSEYLDRLAKEIEKEIDKAFPSVPTAESLARQAGFSFSYSEADIQAITNPMRDLIARGGKRVRPTICVLTSGALGFGIETAMKLCPLPEIAHTGTLIVDDIEDDSTLRRGKPAAHLIYGLDMTINGGNLAYFSASEVIENAAVSREHCNELYTAWDKTMRAIHWGQGMDIIWHNDAERIPSTQEYESMCRLKTGAMFAFSAQIGAIASGASNRIKTALMDTWRELGLGFQLLDDAGNLKTGSPGKERGDDLREGKKSYPALLFASRGERESNWILSLLEAAKLGDNNAIEEALSTLNRVGVVDETIEHGAAVINRQKEALSVILPKGQALDALLYLCDTFIRAAG